MKYAIFTPLIMLLKSATVQCTVQECAYNFVSAGFDLGDFDNYDNWYGGTDKNNVLKRQCII